MGAVTYVILAVLVILLPPVLLAGGWILRFCIVNIPLWLESNASGLGIGFSDFVRMKLRRLDMHVIVAHLKILRKAGIDVTCRALESHVLAGGNLDAVTSAVVAADKAGIDIDFSRIAAIDLAGRDVLDAVESRVNPKVLVCPPSGTDGLSSVALDGVKLKVTARITVRTRLDKVVGGAGEATVIARVGGGIVAAIGRAESHRKILEHPETIAKVILDAGLDSGTCFEIVSIDIAEVDVVENIAARLKSEKAEADKKRARALAEGRRANARALHQEMVSRSREMESNVRSARSVVPESLAAALSDGNLGSPAPLNPLLPSTRRWSGSREGALERA